MKTRFVAEVSSNHQRDLARALAFIDSAAEIGCAAVKFQQFKIRELFAPEALAAHPKLLEREKWEFPESFNAELAARARAKKIQFASTPFYRGAVELLAPHVDFFKLASYQLLWTEMLALVARTKKPVVLATGMASLEEVKQAVGTLRTNGCTDLTLLHCVSSYPAKAAEANLAALETLRKSFGCAAGWSDHTRDPAVLERAVRRWQAAMIEFHYDLDGQGDEAKGGHCWLPGQIAWVIQNLAKPQPCELSRSHVADGDGLKKPRDSEAEERGWRTDPSDGLRPLLATRRRLARELAA
jgi:N-acetylneuraminate synthase